MRNAYSVELEELDAELGRLGAEARAAMVDATKAWLSRDLHSAETAIARSDVLTDLARSCEDRTVAVLALQAPVATDLRRVFAAVSITSDLVRMGQLAVHIAESVRRRFPTPVVPDGMVEDFREMATACLDLSTQINDAIATADLTHIENVETIDARVEAIHARILTELADDDAMAADVPAAVDVALLCRYYGRYADQAVDVAQRVEFHVSGQRRTT